VLSLTFLGTGAACPTPERNVSSLVLSREGETIVFDCGEGTQRQMMRYGTSFGFREIFFTHFHSDHMLGLTGLLRTMGLLNVLGQADREEGITLYGPKGAKQILGAALSIGVERTKFPVAIYELKDGDVLKRKEYDLCAFATEHRTDSLGYALVEHDRKGRFDPDHARGMGIPEGPLWGRIHKGEAITLDDGRRIESSELVGPPRPGRTVVISGDTRPCAALREAARGADLLVHEATFTHEDAARARETGHSTAREAAQLARDAKVRRLVLTHISPRYSREAPELLAEAQEIFPETVIARDGLEVDVPFRGEQGAGSREP
jgi:ribonuclease Z